jgi:hypothetical protein
METTKDLITDKAIKLVTDDYVADNLIDEKNIRKIINDNLTAILKGYSIDNIPKEILYQLALITNDMKITEIGREYAYLYNKEKKEVYKIKHKINKQPYYFTKDLKSNKKDLNNSYMITEAHGDENKTEITEIKIESTGEKIRKGDTVYDAKTSKYFLDVDFKELSNNLIRGKYNGSGLYSFIPLKNVRTTEINKKDTKDNYITQQINKLWKEIGDIWSILKKDELTKLEKKTSSNDDTLNFEESTKKIFEEKCYLLYDVNNDKKFVTFDKEYAYNLYHSGGHVLNEYPIINPENK